MWRPLVLIPVAACTLLAACNGPTPGVRAPTQTADERGAAALAAAEAKLPENPLKNAYFGEQHVHTSYSLDAYIGGARLTPNDAYRFARGETMTVNSQKHNIGRPLDWAAVTDHAEYIGEMYSTQVAGATGHDNPQLAELRGLTSFVDQEAWFLKYVVSVNRGGGKPAHPPFYAGPDTTRSAWQIEIKAATDNYVPGKFSTLVAFEWSGAPKGANLHRNVFFRDLVVPDAPFSYIDGNREDALWVYLADAEAHGSQVFAIPHNSNASKGVMFGGLDGDGKPYTAAYAKTRNHFEPLVEMMQIKGNSEVTRSFWAADEFADFENADSLQNYSGRTFAKPDFVRWAEARGLDYQRTLGTNPFQMGFVGGTDNHNGMPSDVNEGNFIGSHGAADATVERRRTGEVGGWLLGKDLNPGALTGVWATRNTRAAIWDGMHARETFATSGPRIKVRMFAGADLARPTDPRALVADGYRRGVPMGGVLPRSAHAPRFTVYAEKDPDGANLDRIQIIKAWTDASGEPQDRVIDVVWSGPRIAGPDGKVPAVGNTVDLRTARYTNSIGAPTLIGSWIDPDFRPDQNAVYYARVIEIPTPRWSTFDAVRNHLPLLAGVPATIQERAWGSPIWYMPQ
jgi:hypothetical protein